MMRMLIGLAVVVTATVAPPGPSGRAGAQMLAYRSAGSTTEGTVKGKRVQADLAREIESWRGGSGCASRVRARSALKPVFARWLGTQTIAHPDRKLAGWGYHSGDIWTESRVVDGKRACSAGFRKLIAYAEFR